jgi:hypothetical protein
MAYSFSLITVAADCSQPTGSLDVASERARGALNVLDCTNSQVRRESGLFDYLSVASCGTWNNWDPGHGGVKGMRHHSWEMLVAVCTEHKSGLQGTFLLDSEASLSRRHVALHSMNSMVIATDLLRRTDSLW